MFPDPRSPKKHEPSKTLQVLKANWANLGRVADSVEEGGRAVGCPMPLEFRR